MRNQAQNLQTYTYPWRRGLDRVWQFVKLSKIAENCDHSIDPRVCMHFVLCREHHPNH
jgi:hypothetical protein